MKTCTRCGHPKELKEFHRHSGMADGHHPWCKASAE